MAHEQHNAIRMHRRRMEFPSLKVVPHTEADFIDHWNFPIDTASDSVGREAAAAPVKLELAPTSGSTIVTMSLDDLQDVRRELQRSANAVEHAMFLIDTYLNQRQSA